MKLEKLIKNRSLKFVLLIVVCGCFQVRGYALDYGAIFYTNTNVNFEGTDTKVTIIDQMETLAPYVNRKIGDSLFISAEALFRHKLVDVFGFDFDTQNQFVADLPLLKVENRFSFLNGNSLRLSVGRMYMIDATGSILSQTIDGALGKYTFGNMEAGLYVGYTGLQNIKNTEMLLSSGIKYTLAKENPVYDFSAPYVIGAASFVMPYLFLQQTLSFEAIGLLKSAGPNALPDNEKNRFYGTAMISGQILPVLFHAFSLTAETNNFSELALFVKFLATYFAEFKDSRVTFAAVYASGKNGSLSPFTGITKQSSCLSSEEPGFSGIFKLSLDGSMIPFYALGGLKICAGADFVFDVLNVIDSSGFYGVQPKFSVDWDVYSDLSVSIGANTFIGSDKSLGRTEITASVILAF